MTKINTLMFASLALSALTTPVLAQGEGTLMRPETMMVMGHDGRMTTMAMTDKTMMDAMMKDGKVMTGSHMFMMSGGKMYMMEDRRMTDGRMMSDHMRAKP